MNYENKTMSESDDTTKNTSEPSVNGSLNNIMPRNKIYTYKILNKINGHFYVGSTSVPDQRQSNHFRALKRGKHHSVHLQRAVDKYGIENFEFMIIAETDIEQSILDEHFGKPHCYNCYATARFVGRGHTFKMKPRKRPARSEETRRKISKGNKGKKRTEEQNRVNSEVHKGQTVTLAMRKKISDRGKERYENPEEIEKLKTRMEKYWKTADREEFSKKMKDMWANISDEKRKELGAATTKRQTGKSHTKERVENMKAGRKKAMTPDKMKVLKINAIKQLEKVRTKSKEAVKKMWSDMTPEQRSAKARYIRLKGIENEKKRLQEESKS